MTQIVIISGSVRIGRKSNRVAAYFNNYLKENNIADSEILDLKEYDFPIFEERLKYLENPSDKILQFTEKIKNCDGVILVTPEYNGGYPASVKNVIDLLYEEWHRKPIAISTVSSGAFGGSQVITSLQFVLWKMRANVIEAMFPVAKVQDTFAEDGSPSEKEETNKRAKKFIDELMWKIESLKKMQG